MEYWPKLHKFIISDDPKYLNKPPTSIAVRKQPQLIDWVLIYLLNSSKIVLLRQKVLRNNVKMTESTESFYDYLLL